MANNLRALRKSKKITVKQLADSIGENAHSLYKWETGRTPPTHKAKKIAEYFKTSIEAIFFEKQLE